jgi:DNA-binding NarL/FixJ family response regulator
MVRIALFSQDSKLQQLLSSVLGKEYQIILEPDEEGIHRLFSSRDCDVVVLDLDTNHGQLQQRIACAERIVASNISPVVLVDDGLRSIALDLVRRGAHS